MTFSPHIDTDSDHFPGDTTPQPPFGLKDTLRSMFLWSIGAPHLAAWSLFIVAISKLTDTKNVDSALKLMAKAIPKSCGVEVEVHNREMVRPEGTYVFVFNHVNIFDMFVIYQAVPGYTRSLEHIDHFSWPLLGPFITAVGQIPVDPDDRRTTAKGLKKAAQMLEQGDSLVVLPEGSRTFDGSVGHFYPGAFRLAIGAGVPVVPVAIKGGRAINRRGDFRIRPGKTDLFFAQPIETKDLNLKDAQKVAQKARQAIIDLLQGRS